MPYIYLQAQQGTRYKTVYQLASTRVILSQLLFYTCLTKLNQTQTDVRMRERSGKKIKESPEHKYFEKLAKGIENPSEQGAPTLANARRILWW